MPPTAGTGLFTAMLDFIKLTTLFDNVVFGSSWNGTSINFVNSPLATLSSKPLPVVYVIVRVVLEGACPYALLYKKFEGPISISIDFVNCISIG